ncbi:MurR/RpiR family transcriptional regulator [Leisingera sp. M658]|uniref:MurR/RpiR family transcriptional regulator n=1 Tax=Leisingera sp. M658 TaxID=2867015 RepID=UPI0021A2BB15|nr:MurR/RpiR family transcriptional regulator [Leisingera sp. M658]UWQ75819.1 MurR/RpiR family transcriptional regulator [Leisingera sp. M658]
MPTIIDRILNELPDLPKKLRVAAKFAVDRPDRMAFGSMRAVATESGVSSPTMHRLARYFDYESYDEFKTQFQTEVAASSFSTRAEKLYESRVETAAEPLLKGLQDAARENIDAGFQNNPIETLQAIGDTIRTARTTHIVATGSMAWVAAHLEATGGIAFPGLRMTRSGVASAIETLATVQEGDAVIAIAVSPYAKSAIEALEYARDIGVTTLAITDRRSSPLVGIACHSIIAPTNSPHYYPSVVSICSLVEAVLAFAVADSAGGAIGRIEKVVSLRKQSGAYLE